MDLAKCEDIARGIVQNAIKELLIEKAVKEIAEVWKTTEFTLHKHTKGNKIITYMLNYSTQLNVKI